MHDTFEGIRWLDQVSESGENAPHKRRRLNYSDWLARQLAQNKRISPLFSVPGVTTSVFRRDWLHAADQGVGADFLGNLFKVLASVLPGNNKKERRLALLERIRIFYDQSDVKDRLIGLKPWGIQAPKKPPKLKSSAAACRALIPFADEAATALLDPANPKHRAMQVAARSLRRSYDCLSNDSPHWRHVLPAASRDFAIQCEALRDTAEGKDWVIKPKMHQFLEMCTSGSKPNLSWTYRDEDYGGTIAQLCRIKGGCWKRVSTYSNKMLTLFKSGNQIPRIV